MKISVEKYYENSIVRNEITEFCRNRWVAIHCEHKTSDGRPMLVRYDKGRPLTIKSPNDIQYILRRFRGLKPRTFYATASIYSKLETKEDALNYEKLVIAKTPTWDIDSKPEWWKATIEVIKIIVKALENEGVKNSVYIKWSGRGAHVHIHEKAISNKIYSKYKPLNIAYGIVEYIIRKIKSSIIKVNMEFKTEIKVENLIDPQRVFTAPLSLHKQLDVACIAFKPDQLDEFNFEWTNPLNFKHNPDWKNYVEGEADPLAIKAFRSIGPYPREVKREPPQIAIELKPIQKRIETFFPEKKELKKIIAPIAMRFRLEDLRLNLNPPPIAKGRKFSKGPSEAFLKIEDILSHYALRRIDLDHAIKALKYAKDAIIPFQNYRPEEINELIKLYEEAIKILMKLNSPEKVKQWLLSHGPPKKIHVKLDEFFK